MCEFGQCLFDLVSGLYGACTVVYHRQCLFQINRCRFELVRNERETFVGLIDDLLKMVQVAFVQGFYKLQVKDLFQGMDELVLLYLALRIFMDYQLFVRPDSRFKKLFDTFEVAVYFAEASFLKIGPYQGEQDTVDRSKKSRTDTA